MVTFIPPCIGEEVKSNAERKVFEALKELDIDGAYVLHSLGLPRHQSKLYGEIDFVIICKRGILCLEIKGGRVECRDGIWIFTDRFGVENMKPEGPFAQVKDNMFNLKYELKNRFDGNPHIRYCVVGCGVVFPDIVFRATTEEMIPEIIYDSTAPDITGYINRVYDYWESRDPRVNSMLSPADIKSIVSFLRGNFCFMPTLEDRLNSVEKRLVRLTAEQNQLMTALGLNSHLLIEGGAGTGKTLLAVEHAKKKAAEGRRVLYLTFNKNLANNINAGLESDANLKVINLHALFGEYVPVDLNRMKENTQKYFNEDLPEAFIDYVGGLTAEELDELQCDILIVDEGQDIIKPIYLCCLDILLKNGLESGNWVIFHDELQNIYNPDYASGMELIESYPHTKFRLHVNCRNTVQIGTYSSRVSGVEISAFLQENGEEVQCISYADEKDFRQQLKELMKHMRDENIKLSDITFLGPKKYENSILGRIGFDVNELGDNFDAGSQRPRYATIQGFKGLDSKIVVLVDVDNLYEKNFSRYIYIAATRARTLLYVFAPEVFLESHRLS